MKLEDEIDAMRYVKRLKGFWSHFLMYLIFAVTLLIFTVPDQPDVLWGLLGWGCGVLLHGLFAYRVINFFGPEWERKMIEKHLNKKQ